MDSPVFNLSNGDPVVRPEFPAIKLTDDTADALWQTPPGDPGDNELQRQFYPLPDDAPRTPIRLTHLFDRIEELVARVDHRLTDDC